MVGGANLGEHFNTSNQVISDMLRVDIKFDDEDKTMMLLTCLSISYEHLVITLCYGKETPKFREILGALMDHHHQK